MIKMIFATVAAVALTGATGAQMTGGNSPTMKSGLSQCDGHEYQGAHKAYDAA